MTAPHVGLENAPFQKRYIYDHIRNEKCFACYISCTGSDESAQCTVETGLEVIGGRMDDPVESWCNLDTKEMIQSKVGGTHLDDTKEMIIK